MNEYTVKTHQARPTDVTASSQVDSVVDAPRAGAPASAIVFGGSGFIGSRLVWLLITRGVKDIAIADLSSPRYEDANVRFIRVDVREPITIPGSWDVAYNFSAVHRTPGHADEEYFETNVAGAINVTNFCSERGIDTIVFTSSIAVYGPTEDLLTEDSPVEPTSSYGKSKLLAEHVHRTWHSDEARRKLVVVRPAVIFGDGEGGNFDRLRGSLPSRRFAYPGRTDTIKACGYVEELVRSIEWVRTGRASSVTYNFAYPQRLTIKQVANDIAEFDGSRGATVRIPLAPMIGAATAFEILARVGLKSGINRARVRKLVTSTNIYPGYLVAHGYPFDTNLRDGIRAGSANVKQIS